MGKSANLGQLDLNKRSLNAGRQACDAQNLSHNRAHAVGFPIRSMESAGGNITFGRNAKIIVSPTLKTVQIFGVFDGPHRGVNGVQLAALKGHIYKRLDCT